MRSKCFVDIEIVREEREKIQNVDIERNRYIKGRYRKGYTVEIERDVR